MYASKLSKVISSFKRYGEDLVIAEDTMSGINIRLNVMSDKDADKLCGEASSLKLHMVPLPEMPDNEIRQSKHLLFYYDQIPEDEIENSVKSVCSLWKVV